MATTSAKTTRQRVPASERRDALIDAAIHEFAHGGLHGTPVDKIARRVGVRLGAFDEDPGIRPAVHQFVAYAAPWEPIPDDGLPRYPERRVAD